MMTNVMSKHTHFQTKFHKELKQIIVYDQNQSFVKLLLLLLTTAKSRRTSVNIINCRKYLPRALNLERNYIFNRWV